MALWQEKALREEPGPQEVPKGAQHQEQQREQEGSASTGALWGSTDKGGQQGGKQSGAKEMPQEMLERLSARDQLRTRAQLGTVWEHFLKDQKPPNDLAEGHPPLQPL
eukprot:546753-Pelagomonas_calceolata.AAC.1